MIANTKDPHEMFFKWLSFNGIYSIKPNFKIEHRYTKAQNGYIMPDISKELYLDLLNLRDKLILKNLISLYIFFKKLQKNIVKKN